MQALAGVITSFFSAMRNIECTIFGKYTFSLWDIIVAGLVFGIIGYFISELLDR